MDLSDFFSSLPSQLTELNIRNNFFLGSADIGKFTRMTYLDLSYNYFAGYIFSSVGNLTELNFLNLEHNNFSGSLPPEFGVLSHKPNIILLNDNGLSGYIST